MGCSAKEEKSAMEESDELEDEVGKTLTSLRQVKKKTAAAAAQSVNGTPSARCTKATAKIKKEKPKDEDDDEDEKPIARKVSKATSPKMVESKDKKKIKKKKQIEEEDAAKKKKKKRTAGENGKKEKKVYDLPGQKHDAPGERDPLRIFYESLYNQHPESEMAALWMMEWGLLPLDEAKKVYEKKVEKKQLAKLESPVKTAAVKKTSKTVTKKTVETKVMVKTTKKQKMDSSDGDDDDFMPTKVSKKAKMNANGDDDFTPARKKFKKSKISS